LLREGDSYRVRHDGKAEDAIMDDVKRDNWIRTYTGRRFTPLDPQVEDITREDIAHALSNICRYTGHVSSFYSVAQHSCIVSAIIRDILEGTVEEQFFGLMHDASEAYLTDIARPVKIQPAMAMYREAERRLEYAIARKFDLPGDMPEIVKKADTIALATEARDLMGDPQDWEILNGVYRLERVIDPLPPEKAEAIFWKYFDELSLKMRKEW
jgi:5'-deoxynucleotidase YfbR-like HD superfamily hydrolase